jgi:hypothetical protein
MSEKLLWSTERQLTSPNDFTENLVSVVLGATLNLLVLAQIADGLIDLGRPSSIV